MDNELSPLAAEMLALESETFEIQDYNDVAAELMISSTTSCSCSSCSCSSSTTSTTSCTA